MKKSIIAAGAASVALAAMPIVGVFAADGTGSVVDSLSVTVDPSCTISGDGTQTGTDPDFVYTKDVDFGAVANGQTDTADGSLITIYCNDGSGWMVNAIASNSAQLTGTSGTSTPIAAGVTTTGNASSWALKMHVESGDGVSDTLVDSAEGFIAAPAASTKVAHSTKETATTTSDTLQASYQVYIGTAQEADTYTGSVTYTLVHPNV